jgi:hypothetical protein
MNIITDHTEYNSKVVSPMVIKQKKHDVNEGGDGLATLGSGQSSKN